MEKKIYFEINDAPRDTMPFDLPEDKTIADLKNEIKKSPEYENLNPDDYMLLIEGDFQENVKIIDFFLRC